MKISKALKSDIKKLFEIEQKVFENDIMAMSLSSFYYHVEKSFFYKVEVNKKIVGYILWLKRKKFYRLYSLAILEDYRKLNIASSLLKYSLKNLESKSLQLEVRESNTKAINLYEKFNFKKVKILENYYNNENAVLMKLER
ncbi:GNAT family N-acetyltransferase [Halarcobacter mediterraneus]|uniref:GNAT family N-acetyltransferase n=1 Tax=Halarcobacter mediterraneus TaxID=2023153 RepID=A0A4Q1AQD3_9BACT|nr:GNAT family N-acetyltransferase [Halarcobacter mediterraneus]RXK11603.1 GNAT family N-acetyltransferase [Halarcobacter mediterraneus]